ncbi:hypothetical protein I3843_04G163900 [Carya illinoinensis]|nr:hypothetical protein I3843_04G163900 [Carya illinoinensis]
MSLCPAVAPPLSKESMRSLTMWILGSGNERRSWWKDVCGPSSNDNFIAFHCWKFHAGKMENVQLVLDEMQLSSRPKGICIINGSDCNQQ